MAITDSYATTEEYRAKSGGTDAGGDEQISDDLEAVSRWLEHELGQFFNVDDEDVTRLYTPAQAASLWIDNLSADPTSIKIDSDNDGDFSDETALAAADYELLPFNALVGPEPGPYTRIKLTPWGAKSSWKNLRVQIIGKWGWPSVPRGVKESTIEFTRLWRMESPRATTQITELDGVVGMSRSAQSMLDKLMSKYKVVHIA